MLRSLKLTLPHYIYLISKIRVKLVFYNNLCSKIHLINFTLFKIHPHNFLLQTHHGHPCHVNETYLSFNLFVIGSYNVFFLNEITIKCPQITLYLYFNRNYQEKST